MVYQTNRHRLHKYAPEYIFGTDEMVVWIRSRTGAPDEMSDALLGAWINLIRAELLRREILDGSTSERLEHGEEFLLLSHDLAPRRRCLGPGNWSSDELWAWISVRTGLLHRDVSLLLHTVADKLRELNGEKAFEPVGWVTTGDEEGFRAHLWDDFLDPASNNMIEAREPEIIRPG
jgi:hypothetical protein